MTRKEAERTTIMLDNLRHALLNNINPDKPVSFAEAREDAESLRRISMTLHRWHELECGSENGAIERDETTGKPYWYNHTRPPGCARHPIPDREAGALKRLLAIKQRYPSLAFYVQGDPRGASLYILRPGDVPEGADASAYYSRGLAVHQ